MTMLCGELRGELPGSHRDVRLSKLYDPFIPTCYLYCAFIPAPHRCSRQTLIRVELLGELPDFIVESNIIHTSVAADIILSISLGRANRPCIYTFCEAIP